MSPACATKLMFQGAWAFESVAYWTHWIGARLRQAGCQTDGLRKVCDLGAHDNIRHRLYERPAISQCERPWVIRTQG
eukprot:6813965-Pyramimonas_sp.AAC.1